MDQRPKRDTMPRGQPLRMSTLDLNRMPAVGSNVVDAEGVALIEAFITSLSGCE